MPQASARTIREWPHGQLKAFELLEKNFQEDSGWYSLKDPNYIPTKEEYAAIQYLIEEWDYGYLSPNEAE